MVSREMEFAIGGLFLLASLFPLFIAILGNFPMLNLGLLINFGGLGLVVGFLGFLLIGTALFKKE